MKPATLNDSHNLAKLPIGQTLYANRIKGITHHHLARLHKLGWLDRKPASKEYSREWEYFRSR